MLLGRGRSEPPVTFARLVLSLTAFRLRHLRCGRAVRYFDASHHGALRVVVVACRRHHVVRRWRIGTANHDV